MCQNSNQDMMINLKGGFQTEVFGLGDIMEVNSYPSYTGLLVEAATKILCIYSKKFIKIFEVSHDVSVTNKNPQIDAINREESLTWVQRAIRWISRGRWYSNKSKLLAQIYDANQLNWWQKAINRVSFGYFYRTTAKIEGISFKYQSEYSDENDKRPALLRLEDVVDPEKGNPIKRQYKQDWVLFKNLQNINENPVKNNISSNSNALGGFPVLDVNNAVNNSAYNEIKTPNDINSNPYYPNMVFPPEDFEQNQDQQTN